MKVWQVLVTMGWAAAAGAVSAQVTPQPVGTVSLADATVQGSGGQKVVLAGGRAELSGSSIVTANPGRNAEVTLTRGGTIRVCQTSVLHAARSAGDALFLALDRGAMEIRMKAEANDIVLTPDLRFTLESAGSLELEMRVSRNGDTCVENRGHKAPVINITDSFGEASYQIKPNQHVLFEHGSLREVVDRETTPCGCPPEAKPGVSIAEALLSAKGPVTPTEAAAAHPFPAAQSEGLAEPEPVAPETPSGGTHVQVGATLAYDPTAPKAVEPESAGAPAPEAVGTSPTPPVAAQTHHNPFAAVGDFFMRLFVR